METSAPSYKYKISTIQNEPLSRYLGFSALILCVCTLFVMFLTRILHLFLPLMYGKAKLDSFRTDDRRSFVYHHAAFIIKVILFIAGIYPWSQVIIGKSEFDTPLHPEGNIRMGDVLLVTMQLFCAGYIGELQFRAETLQKLMIAHHVASVMAVNIAIAMSVHPNQHRSAAVQVYLCYMWGFFTIIAGLPRDLVLIVRRLSKQQHPRFIRGALFATASWAFTITVVEIIVTSLCLIWSSHRLTWLKFVVPICFAVWIIAQLHFELVIYRLGLKQNQIIMEQCRMRGAVEDVGNSIEREPSMGQDHAKEVPTASTSKPDLPV